VLDGELINASEHFQTRLQIISVDVHQSIVTGGTPAHAQSAYEYRATITGEPMRLLPSHLYGHPRLMARVRIGVGIWLLALTAILLGSGYWWGALLLAPAALHFYLAYRLLHKVQI
jgi:hypothetical protein